MSTTTASAQRGMAHVVPHASGRAILRSGLLACGVLYALLYVVSNDVVAATRYEGYSRLSQAISELSATSAPTKPFLTALLPIFTALLMAFGIGVWKSAQGSRRLRVTGALLFAHGATAPIWVLFPMTTREEMGATMPVNDLGHLLLSAAAIAFILAQMGFGGAALGKRFRLYSLVSAATVVVFGALTGIASREMPTGEPTPWLGLVERISFGAWLLWISMLAGVLLWRSRRPEEAQGGASSANSDARAARVPAPPSPRHSPA